MPPIELLDVSTKLLYTTPRITIMWLANRAIMWLSNKSYYMALK